MSEPIPPTPTKPGYKTTEFWLSTAAIVIGLLYAAGVVAPEGTDALSKAIAFGATALAALGYSVSRGLAKKG
jgi:hypothetical protein